MSKARHLNDDVFFNVLSRVPVRLLAGLRRVSREWRGLISDRAFVDAQLRRTKPELSGFIFQQRFQWSDADFKTVTCIPLGGGQSRVLHTVFDFLPEDVVVLASCHGLICCRSCFPTQDLALYICNPLKREWLALRCSELELDKDSIVALAFDPLLNPVCSSTSFDLVRVRQLGTSEDEMWFTFEVYSSSVQEWRHASKVCRCNDQLLKGNNGVYINGTVHWLTDGDKVLAFAFENDLSWLIKLPIPAKWPEPYPPACIGASGARLHCVMVSEEGLHLWGLEDGFEGKWRLEQSLSLEAMEREHPGWFCNLQQRVGGGGDVAWLKPLAFEDGRLLLRVSVNIYLFDFGSGEMREVCEVRELGSSAMFFPAVLPYSMGLVPLVH